MTGKSHSKTKQTSFRIPPELLERLDKAASKENRSRNNLLVVLITEGLDRRDEATAAGAA